MESLTLVSTLQLLLAIRSLQAAHLPKYQAIAYPQVFDARDEKTKVLKINEDITLNLEPSSILHENFFVRSYKNGIPEHQYYDIRDLQKTFYHDKKQFAALMLYEEDGTLRVEGVVGPNLKIRPIESTERSEHGQQAHLVDTIEDNDSVEVYGEFARNKVDISERAKSSGTGFDPTKYAVSIIYPELYVLCDSVFQQKFKKREHIIPYLMTTIQVVNIRYGTISGPQVRIVLRGIELTDATQEGRYYVYDGYGIDAYASLQKLVTFAAAENQTYKTFDMMYFCNRFTTVSMYDQLSQSVFPGYAFVGSACTTHRQLLGEDTAYTFRGIRIVTHEIGHALGCSHDGTSAPGIVKAFVPNSLHCPWGDGYIMSYEQHDSRSMRFSSCCRYDISQMSWSREASCLHVNDSMKYPLNWLIKYKLPGDFLSLNRQCEIAYPNLWRTYYVQKTYKWYCKGYCFVPGHQFRAADHYWDFLFVDGTVCLNRTAHGHHGWICLNGECVPDKRGYRELPYKE
nr:venom metalloproteinase 3-like [Rhipicephalus microplus]